MISPNLDQSLKNKRCYPRISRNGSNIFSSHKSVQLCNWFQCSPLLAGDLDSGWRGGGAGALKELWGAGGYFSPGCPALSAAAWGRALKMCSCKSPGRLSAERESTCGSAAKQKNIFKNHYSVYWLPLGTQEKWCFYRVISKKVLWSQAVLLSWYNPREGGFQCRFLRFPVGRERK